MSYSREMEFITSPRRERKGLKVKSAREIAFNFKNFWLLLLRFSVIKPQDYRNQRENDEQ